MKVKDHETATTYIASYLAFDPQVIETILSDTIISLDEDESSSRNGGRTVADASVIMNTAKKQLFDICDQEFDTFAQKGNDAELQRVWRLFPRLGESEFGLDKYGRYISTLLRKQFQIALIIGEKNGLSFKGGRNVQ